MNSQSIRSIRSGLILIIDLLAAFVIFSGLYQLRLNDLPDYFSPNLWLIIITFVTTLFLFGTYFREKYAGKPQLPIKTFFVCLIGGLLCIFWMYLLGPNEFNTYFGRGVLPFGTLLFGITATLSRLIINRIYHWQESNTELLYLGYSPCAERFIEDLQKHTELRSVTILSNQPIAPSATAIEHTDNTQRLFQQKNWQGVIIDPQTHPNEAETKRLVELRLLGLPVLTLAEYYEKFWFRVPVDQIGDDWFLRSQGFSMLGSTLSIRLKRILDIVAALVLLVISWPLILLCAAAIKLSSPGPAFFAQSRVGMQGKIFTIYKLRTMVADAEQAGAQWASKDDPRITRIGNFLRKSRLDELPQAWNVLKGDMSFVGPRPERPEFMQELQEQIPYYDLRHIVKPGITGWAQVIFPYGASVEDALEKLEYELYYIKNQSLLLDLNILLRTAITVFQRAGR